jgi:prepilin-type N-terminal cleavage/methylation domain-containing protein
MSQIKRKSKLCSFTLIELLYVMGILGLIMPAMFALFNFMIKANREISARQSSIQQ